MCYALIIFHFQKRGWTPKERAENAVPAACALAESWISDAWQFLTNPKDFTGNAFAAMSLMVAAPVAVVYLILQTYIAGGLRVGSVK